MDERNAMDEVKFREWKSEDFEQIADLWLELATYVNPMDGFYQISPEAKKNYKKYLSRVYGDRNAVVFVAEFGEELVGFAMGRINRNPAVVIPEAVGYIENVFISENQRTSGIGTVLCTRLLEWFKNRGVSHVELFYQIENDAAAAFWKKMGFTTWLAKAYKGL
jgi:ribosomal protein S18 acetylase RimI-like enzyme